MGLTFANVFIGVGVFYGLPTGLGGRKASALGAGKKKSATAKLKDL